MTMVAKSSRLDRQNGFSPRIEAAEVRRQLHMSLGVVAVLAIGIVSSAVTVGKHPWAAKRDVAATAAPVTVMHAETNAVGAKRI